MMKEQGPLGVSLNRGTRDREGPESEIHLKLAHGGGM